jgi:hypothetical protein
MTFVNKFSEKQLQDLGFQVIRKEESPQKIKIHEVDIARANIFATLENSKHINAEFIDFEDQAWILSKGDVTHILFGRMFGDPITIEKVESGVYLHRKDESYVANSSIEAFSCCMNYLQSIADKGKSQLLCRRYFGDVKDLEKIPFGKTLEEDAAGLRNLIEAIDPIALEPGSLWDIVLCQLEDGMLPLLIQPDFYFVNGRLLPSQ